MSKNAKIIIGIIVGGLLLLCCLGGALAYIVLPRLAKNAFINDPAQAAEVGQSIVEYDLPSGYKEGGAMNFGGIKMVFITSGESKGMFIMLMRFPAAMGGNQAEMERQMNESLARQQGQRNLNLSVVGTEEVTINDERVTLTKREGTDEDGAQIRQVTGVFNAKNGGPAMLMVMGPITRWRDSDYNHFINSMR